MFKKCTKDLREDRRLKRRRSLNVNQIFTGDSRPIKLQCVHNDLGMDDPHGITDEEETSKLFILCHYNTAFMMNVALVAFKAPV